MSCSKGKTQETTGAATDKVTHAAPLLAFDLQAANRRDQRLLQGTGIMVLALRPMQTDAARDGADERGHF